MDVETVDVVRWDDVEFVCSDETVTKTYGFNKPEFMYHVQTVVAVGCNGQIKVDKTKLPNFKAQMNDDDVFVAIGNSLHIISGNFSEMKCSLFTNDPIECFAVCGDFILLGEANGTAKLIFIPLNQTVLSQKFFIDCDETESSFIDISFSKQKKNGFFDALICGSNNVVYRIIDIDLGLLRNALRSSDLDMVCQLRDQVKISALNIASQETVITSIGFNEFHHDSVILMTGLGNYALKMWSAEEEVNDSWTLENDVLNSEGFLKATLSPGQRFIVALDCNNVLHLLCSQTLLHLKSVIGLSVSDFTFWESSTNSTVELETKLLVLTVPKDNECLLQIFNFPTFEEIFTQKMSDICKFVSIHQLQENLAVIEGSLLNSNLRQEDGKFNCFKVKLIQEMLPETKLSRYLKHGKFSEAEQFAKNFKLDLQIIYWAKFNYLAEKLLQQTSPNADLEIEFLACVEKLNQPKLLVEFCQSVLLPNADLFKKLLTIVKEKLKHDDESVALLRNLLFRLTTFQYVFGDDHFKSHWNWFATCSISNEFLNQIQQANVTVVFCFWLRHETEILNSISLEELLNAIGSTMPVEWIFSNFLPSALRANPEHLITAVEWMIQYCHTLEITERHLWPGNARKYVDRCLTVVNELYLTDHSLPIESSMLQDCLGQLKSILVTLKDLETLQNDYDCQISFSDFTGDKTTVCFQLLDSVLDFKKFHDFISNFMKRFIKRFQLDLDTILIDYLKNILTSADYGKFFWDQTDIEARVDSVLKSISSNEHLFQAILIVISVAPTWSAIVKDLVDWSLNFENPYSSEIKQQLRLYKIRKILSKFDCPDFELTDGKFFPQIIQFLLSRENPPVEDALEIAKLSNGYFKEMDVYFCYAQIILMQNKDNEFETVLDKLPKNALISFCKRFVTFVQCMINVSRDLQDETQGQIERCFLRAVIIACNQLLKNSSEIDFQEFSTIRAKIQTLLVLQLEFSVYLSFEDLDISTKCEDTFKTTAEKLLNENSVDNETRNDVGFTTLSTLLRLGKLLIFEDSDTFRLILKILIDLEDFESAIKLVQNFKNEIGFTKPGRILTNIGLCLQNLLTRNVNLIKIIPFLLAVEEFLKYALAFSTQVDAGKFVSVLKWTALLKQIYSNERPRATVGILFHSMYDEVSFIKNNNEIVKLIVIIITNLILNEKNCEDRLIAGKKICEIFLKNFSLVNCFHVVTELINFAVYEVTANEKANLAISTILNNLYDFRNSLLKDLILNILSQKPFDKNLALALAFNLPFKFVKDTLIGIINKNKFDHELALCISDLGFELSAFWMNPSDMLEFEKISKHAIWARKFSEMHISISASRDQTNDEWHNVLPEFLSHPNCTVDLVKEFCLAFNCNVDETLLLYMEYRLVLRPLPNIGASERSWQSAVTNEEDNLGNDSNTGNFQIEVFNRRKKSACKTSKLEREISKIIELIDNKKLVYNHLKTVVEKICAYDYETISVILNLLLEMMPNELSHKMKGIQTKVDFLNFLMVYLRNEKPSEYEMSTFGKNVPADIITIRLPYHAFFSSNPWKLITPELSLKTASVWECVVTQLQLSSRDEIFAIALYNEAQRFIQQKSGQTGGGAGSSRSFLKLEKIFVLLEQISNPTLALSCANFVTENLPMGEDKVKAAHNMIMLAKTWNDKENLNQKMKVATRDSDKSSTTEDNFKKIMSMYEKITTEYELIKYDLKNPETLRLIRKPKKLIEYFYKNCSEDGKPRNDNKYKFVENIAVIYELNLQEIQMTLIEKWLNSGENLELSNIIFILGHLPLEETVLYLINKIIQDEHSGSYIYKYRSLKCLNSIANSEMIKLFSKNCIVDTWGLTQSLRYLSRFEELRIPVSLSTFNTCDKAMLTETIWKKYNQNFEVVKIVANLMLDFDINNVTLEKEVINQLINRKLINILELFVLGKKNRTDLWETDEYIDAWKLIVASAVENGNLNSSVAEKAQAYVQVAEKLFRTPAFVSEYLPVLCSRLWNSGFPAVAVGCLFHLSDAKNMISWLGDYSDIDSLKVIHQNLMELENEKIIFPQQLQVVRFLLTRIEEEVSLHGLLTGAAYVKEFTRLQKTNGKLH